MISFLNKFAEEEYDNEYDDEEVVYQEPGIIRKFLQNVIKGTAIGAGIGGLGGYFGAKPIRDAYVTPYGFDWTRNIQVPLPQVRGATVPAGILSGALLGAVGGAVLPPIFEKKSSEQKYAGEYLDNLIRNLKQNVRPFDTSYGLLNIAPLTAIAGSLGGGIIGGLRDPGENEDGTPKSRLSSALTGAGIGAGLGAAAGVAAPAIAKFTAVKTLPHFIKKIQPADGEAHKALLETLSQEPVLDKILPKMNLGQILDYAAKARGKITPNMIGDL
jgi:hypothetical protein